MRRISSLQCTSFPLYASARFTTQAGINIKQNVCFTVNYTLITRTCISQLKVFYFTTTKCQTGRYICIHVTLFTSDIVCTYKIWIMYQTGGIRAGPAFMALLNSVLTNLLCNPQILRQLCRQRMPSNVEYTRAQAKIPC